MGRTDQPTVGYESYLAAREWAERFEVEERELERARIGRVLARVAPDGDRIVEFDDEGYDR